MTIKRKLFTSQFALIFRMELIDCKRQGKGLIYLELSWNKPLLTYLCTDIVGRCMDGRYV